MPSASQRPIAIAIALSLLGLPTACIRPDPVLLQTNSGNFDWLTPPPPLPDELFAVSTDLERTPICGDEFLEPTLRIDVPDHGVRVSHLMNFRCGQQPALEVRVRGRVIQVIESAGGKPGDCKCSQAVHASIRLGAGRWTVEIIRGDQRRLLAREENIQIYATHDRSCIGDP